MKKMTKKTILSVMLTVNLAVAFARQPMNQNGGNANNGSSGSQGLKNRAAGCAPAQALRKLQYNNVSAIIETGGNMWEDRATSNSGYEVPKTALGNGPKAIYAGALWMGGVDFNNQLKLAALRYRTNGNDFWPGPLLTDGTAEVSPATCIKYDKFFVTLRQDVITFNAWYECSQDPLCDESAQFPGYSIPQSILNWPGNNFDPGYDFQLAPYYDRNQDGIYNPLDGDYPWYDIKKDLPCGTNRIVTLYGDQNFWWVFNDKGNIHVNSGGDPIGMEIRAQAFAFNTNDEVNDMTFYNYELINRGTQTLFNTYFGQYSDPDLGGAPDDYAGCDVQRGMGYVYNADNFDEQNGVQVGYGANPPAIGIDFFEGPFQDNDGLDNPLTTNIANAIAQGGIPYIGIGIGYGDGIADNERFGMRKFVFYNNASGPQGDPGVGQAAAYYGFLRGLWKDNTPFYYGGSAYITSPGVSACGNVITDYVFTGDPNGTTTDPYYWATQGVVPSCTNNWTEISEANPAGDRRMVQSAGPFTLTPGAKNNITVGVVYGRGTDNVNSIKKLQFADDKAQKLFDNCFKILDAPDAPDLTIQELDKEIIIMISNKKGASNNYQNTPGDYKEKDPFIVLPSPLDTLPQATQDELSSYVFEGYKIFQLKDENVSSSNLNDPSKARLVAQCDVKNGVKRLVNFILDEQLGYDVPMLMVDGSDEGIRQSFRIKQDAFTGQALINHKTYYYMAVAYAYNNYKTYDPNDVNALDGQKKPYLESRKSVAGPIKAYSAIPHIPVPEAGGTLQNSLYGSGPLITRIEGTGNGGLNMDLTDESENFIVNNFRMANPNYIGGEGNGPIEVKVVDPLNVNPGTFELSFLPDAQGRICSSNWKLINVNTGGVISSEKSIQIGHEQILPDFGISIRIEQYQYLRPNPTGPDRVAELIGATITFADSSKRWLTGVKDQEGVDPRNWIRAGSTSGTAGNACQEYPDNTPYVDPDQNFEKILEGTWAPYYLCAIDQVDAQNNNLICNVGAPIATAVATSRTNSRLHLLQSVNIVFTPDKSKWSRVPVLEMCEYPALAIGGAEKLKTRNQPSVDKQGRKAGDPGYNAAEGDFISTTGMGWFPGYAIDVESGERLNMAFGEDSWLGVDNGKDMIWNPTSRELDEFGTVVMGGKHHIYIFRNELRVRSIPSVSDPNNKMPAYDHFAWGMNRINNNTQRLDLWRSCMWVGIPLLSPGRSLLETEVKIKIRVKKPYEWYSSDPNYVASATNNNPSVCMPVQSLTYDTTTATNGWRPKYRFSLDNIAVQTNYTTYNDSILNLINIVPNPYYAYSSYEKNRIDTRVKIVNLPEICTIKIFNMSGSLVRTYTKDSPITSLDWDLKNQVGIPIASGVYIVHVDVPGVGEKILKWFGAMRPPDLESF
jgi:hypothetical protein